MASFGTLPPEVFGLILGRLDKRGRYEGTLAAVAATCRGFYKLAMPLLYHNVADRHPALLHWCAQFGRVATAQRLLDAGARPDMIMRWLPRDRDFDAACGGLGPRETYQYFKKRVARPAGSIRLYYSVDLGLTTSFWSPIHLAARSGSIGMVQLLVGACRSTITAPSSCLCGCSVTDVSGVDDKRFPTTDLCLPLHLALCHGQPEAATWLLAHGSPPHVTVKQPASGRPLQDAAPSTSALHDAARFGQLELIRLILDRGYQAEVDVLDHRGLSPLWHAYVAAQWSAVDLLLARGADVDDDLGRGYTPLMDASLWSNHDAAVELIARGANVNVALHAAPYRIDDMITNFGIQPRGLGPIDAWCCWTREVCNGLDLPLESVPDQASQTWQPRPSDNWVQYGHGMEGRRTVVSKLLRAGEHLPPTSAARPPLLVAAAANHLSSVVSELIEHGAPVNLPDKDGVTPLAAVFLYSDSFCPFHHSLGKYGREKTPFLGRGRVSRRSEADLPDLGGCPELRACVELLLQNGANPNLADALGNTPLNRLFVAPNLRRYLGHSQDQRLWITPPDRSRMARLLLRHGASPEGIVKPWTKPGWSSGPNSSETWLARHWPSTPLRHAFWDSDYESCGRLLEAGATLDEETAIWMTRLVLEFGTEETHLETQAALGFVETRAPDAWRAALCDPVCFAIALAREWLDLATEIWGHGLELSGFSRTLVASDLHGPLSLIASNQPTALGVLCLDAAVRRRSHFFLNGLLELGVGPIPRRIMLDAVKSPTDILELLVKHGGPVHISDKATSEDEVSRDSCRNPLKLAIQLGYNSTVQVLIKFSQHPIDPRFRAFYLSEACTWLDPGALACLLEPPSMRLVEADITGKVDVPLARLVRLADTLCARNKSHDPGFVGPQWVLRNIKRWMACVTAFARVGVDAAVRDRSGRSALDYLREHMVYVGKNRFKRQLAAELRSIGGVAVEDSADPAACYEALGAMKIDAKQ